MLPEQRVIGSHFGAWRGIIRHQHAHRPRSIFSGQTNAPLGINDAAGKEQGNRSLKIIRVLQEERALLRELHFEALVDRDLRLV